MQNKYKILMFHSTGLNEGQIRDEYHIADSLRELGHEVFTNDETQLQNVDLVLCFKSNTFGIEHVKRWKSLTQAPIWIFTFDRMDRASQFYPIIKECDLWLGEELQFKKRWEEEGLPFYWFPNHSVPLKYFYKVEKPDIYDVVFTGTPYGYQYNPDKFELLRAIQEKFDLHVFGNNENGWKNQGIKNIHPAVFDEKLSDIYGKSKIVLGISNSQCEGYWSIRSAQALMCGAFHLVRFTPQMEKELKDNVEYFQDIRSCLNKIEYYLNNDIARFNIQQRGYEYAQKYLSTTQRVRELIILFENRKSLYGN